MPTQYANVLVCVLFLMLHFNFSFFLPLPLSMEHSISDECYDTEWNGYLQIRAALQCLQMALHATSTLGHTNTCNKPKTPDLMYAVPHELRELSSGVPTRYGPSRISRGFPRIWSGMDRLGLNILGVGCYSSSKAARNFDWVGGGLNR